MKKKNLPSLEIKVKINENNETLKEEKRSYVSLLDLEKEDLELIYKNFL